MDTRAEIEPAVAEPCRASAPVTEPPPTLEQTYRRLAEGLTRFAAGMVGPDDAPDVVASAVARCLRTDWSTVENGDAYLYRAVYNEATGLRRRFARRAGLAHRVPRSPTAAEGAERFVDDQLDIGAALATLSPQQRAVIVLTYWNALPVAAVAERLDLAEGTVKKQLARGRAKLREELS